MEEEVKISYQIKPFWKSVNTIFDKVKKALSEYPQNISDAVAMTSVELVENAVKYGCKGKHCHTIDYNLLILHDNVRIEVVNSFENRDDCDNLITYIDRINSEAEPRSLYGKRLRELLAGQAPVSPSQIGLFRIVSEGEFSLDYRIDAPLVTIVAKRAIS